MNKWLIFISILPLSSFSFANSDFETELRSECAKVKSYANSGRKFYDQKQYQNALGQFQQQASWSAFVQCIVKIAMYLFPKMPLPLLLIMSA